MVFAKAFRRATFPDFLAANAYIQYKVVKAALGALTDESNADATPDTFFTVVEGELARVKSFCVDRIALLTRAAEKLHAMAADEASTQLTAGAVADAGDALMHETLRLQELRNLNMDLLQRVMQRHRRVSVLAMRERWEELIARHTFADLPLDEIWYHLSAIFSFARGDNAASKKQMSKGDDGTQAFDRRSVKYWVHPQDLPFVLARVVKHLPLSVYKDVYKDCKAKGVRYEIAGRISSTYFDSSNFLYYHRRQERLEGSTLFRARWYSENAASDPNDVADDDDVYMEMKVHHETWSGDRSSKRRFALKNRDVDGYLAARLPLTSYVDKMRQKRRSEDEIGQFKDLATEILAKLVAFRLKPVLRTQYKRCAFQLGADASIRISIDTDLAMSTEDFGVGKHWRTRHTRHMDRVGLPFAVVEVKLQCASNDTIPPWVEELMTCRFMESVPKFSKYAHGIAALYGHTARIHIVPYWVHQVDVDIRAATKPDFATVDLTTGLARSWLERARDRVAFGEHERTPPRPKRAAAAPYVTMPTARLFGEVARLTGVATDPALVEQLTQISLHARHDAYISMSVWASMNTSASEEAPCCIPPAEGRHHNDVVHSYNGEIPWQTWKRIRVPQKFDPKNFVTSERYFLTWVQFAVHLAIIGLLLVHFAGGLTGGAAAFGNAPPLHVEAAYGNGHSWNVLLGNTFVLGSAVTLVYSLLALHARETRLFARTKLRFDDVKGPVVLALLLGAGIVAIAMNHILGRFAFVLNLRSDGYTYP